MVRFALMRNLADHDILPPMKQLSGVIMAGVLVLGCDRGKTETPPSSREGATSEVPAENAPPKRVPTPPALSVEVITKASGIQAKSAPGGVVRIGWVRSDVATTIDGMAFPPTAGLGSWAAFAPVSDGAMVMGDTVVFQDEINPAIDAAFSHGLNITALHNHFAFDNPQVYFMHIGGRGDAKKLAAGVKAMWDAIKAVRKQAPRPALTFPGPTVVPGTLDAAEISRLTGHSAKDKPGGVIKIAIPRQASVGGLHFNGNMGLTTWAAFTGTPELAAIDGDIAMTAREVQPVLRALRAAHINIVALHNHMIGEDPSYYFVHYWGKGRVAKLAKGFRAVLGAQMSAAK